MTGFKFQEGDIVIGNSQNNYGITNKDVKCKVIEILDRDNYSGDMRVEVVEGKSKGYRDTVLSSKFDLVEPPAKKVKKLKVSSVFPKPQYHMEFDPKLNATFIRVGDVTIAVPLRENQVSVTVKHPNDVEDNEIAKAVAFYRMAKA